ncbi:MAG: hypothetical protein CMF34_10570 [Leeuwenhoekiella sp.]|nr:hypothetical protein [Leeuwenhoekiella sp.]
MSYLALALLICGFYVLYNTSTKMQPKKKHVKPQVFYRYPIRSKISGVLLLILAFILFTIAMGLATGIFTWFVCLMTVGSLIVLLKPLDLFKR